MKYIKDYYNSPTELLEEADKLIANIHKLVGDGTSHWSLQIQGVINQRKNEALEIVNRAKLLKDLVYQRVSR